ncbi:MAG: hypothetical protein KDN05_03410 [Verrucomicrobiae bacterium]|nr:hypothetical protein [Verrucomicrobiae bacterium]
MVHEGIHSIFANMPGGYNSAWAHESFNVWLQSTMEAQRSGSFSGMGGLSAGSQIAPFIPIECYSGWLQDGSFGGPGGQGVNKAGPNGQICTWRHILGGYQYGEAFPHALAVILGPKAIPWIWNNANQSGYLLQDMALAPGGIGDAQARRVIREYRGRQAFCDFKQWSHAFRQLLHGYWGAVVEEEWSPYDVDVEPWTMTCYVATTNSGGTLTPEARTLPGWSGANQIPLTVDPAATNVSVTFHPTGANMSCQLVYRDTDGVIHYSTPVSSGVCSIPVANVLNNVVIAVMCNTDYVYEGEQTRTAKFGYTLDIGTGITGTADIHTKWWDYNPETYTIAASSGSNGSIHPAGAVVVDNGAVQTFTFSPAPGYKVGDVLLNGLTVGAPSSYTLNPVLGDCTLQVIFRDATPPAVPGSLSALAVNGGVNLDWADNGEPDLDDYNVYRATTSGGDYTPIAYSVSTSSYTDTNVIDGVTYYYVVKAVDVESNESGYSSEASATAIDTVAPAAPTGLTADVAGTTAVLDWTENIEGDLASYTVYRSTTSGTGFVAIATGLTSSDYTDTTLTFGTTYYYVVTATDGSSNESSFSGEASPTSALLAYWDFNDPSLGAANGAAVPDSNGYNIWRTAAVDKSGNGNDLTTWDYASSGFTWSNVSQDGDFSIKSAGSYPSAFTWSSKHTVSGTDVELFTGQSFTVEAVATVTGAGYRSVLSRDAQNLATVLPADAGYTALSLGLDDSDHARFCYTDVNGNYVELRSQTTYPDSGTTFHHFAGTTDGSTVSLYVDGVLVAQTSGANMAGLGIGSTSGSTYHAGGWAVGRSLFWNNHVDRWHGYIDSASISALTLEPGAFVLSDVVAPGDPVPATPTGLAAIASDGTVTLDWADNTEPDFNYYTAYRSETPGTGFSPIRVGLTTSSYTDPRADNGTTFYYVVTATDAALGESAFSAAVSASPTDVTPPAAPAGLSAVPGNGAVSLYWDDNTDPDLVSYTVYRSTTSGSGYAAIAAGLTTSAYVDNTVANGVTYYYVVRAVDTSALESADSVEVSGTANSSEILSGTVIGTPGSWDGFSTIDKVFDGNFGTFYDAVNANGDWAGLDLGSPQQITMVKYAPRGGWAWRMVGGQFQGSNTADFSSGVVTLHTISVQPAEGVLTEQVITDPGTYRYVRYLGPDGGFCNISEAEFYTAAAPDTTPPAAPAGLVATPGAGSVSLDWANNTEPDLASYTVYRSTTTGGGYSAIASGLVSSNYTDNSVTNGTTYYYVVSAKDAASNESTNSSEVSATPADASPPLAPTGLVATAGNGTVILDWNDNPEEDFASYTVYRSTTSGSGYSSIANGLGTSAYTDNTVTNGTTYYYVVTATDTSANPSANSSEASATPVAPDTTPPAAPTGLAASAGDGTVDLDWEDNAEPDLASYTVYRSTTSGSGYVSIASGLASSAYTDETVSNGTTYYYVVTATDNASNESVVSGEVSATPAASAAPQLLNGTVIGSPGSWGNNPAVTKDAVFDGDLGTFYDAVNPTGDWAGLDLGSPQSIVLIKYAPRAGFAFRMVGGMFQGSNAADFSSGVVTLHTVGAQPAEGVLTQQAISDPGTYRYVRYIGPTDGYCNVAELEFYTNAGAQDTTPPAAPTGLAATAGDGSVTLDWADNSEPDLASYTVYRSITSGSGFASIATGLAVSDYTDNTAVNGTTYYYVVTATDTSSNESVVSGEASATPAAVNQAPQFSSSLLVKSNATEDSSYSGSIAGDASDPDAGDTLTFSKVGGPAWLSVAGNGTLSGTPAAGDVGTNQWTVQVSDGSLTDTATLQITVDALPSEATYGATSETSVSGSIVSGSYSSTLSSDNSYEQLREIESGGKPSNRYSYIEHVWSFNLGAGGSAVELAVEAHHSVNVEGDDFVVAYSTDGVNYTDVLTVTKVLDNNTAQTAALPAGLSGVVQIRVKDTNQSRGARQLDSLYVDALGITVTP